MSAIIVKNEKLELLINVYTKKSKNLGNTFCKLGRNFFRLLSIFYQSFSIPARNFLAFYEHSRDRPSGR